MRVEKRYHLISIDAMLKSMRIELAVAWTDTLAINCLIQIMSRSK